MNGLMNPAQDQPSQGRGPPPPLATQGPNSVQPPANRAGNNIPRNNVRPDISMARGNFSEDGISIKENFSIPGFEPPQPNQRSQRRPDMKGPSDITDILSGLKTKTINISEQSRNNTDQRNNAEFNEQGQDNNSSTISINDLRDLQNDGNVPKKTRRKPKSDRNTVSLDI
jgi:hypothetical protein